MTELRGVGIGLGVAQGPIARMAEPLPAPKDTPSDRSVEEETARVREAVAAVARELEARGAQAGGAARDVLEAQAMIAEDPTLEAEVDTRLAAGKNGEFAVHDAFASFREQLVALGGYLGERAADLDDVAQRVIARLRGVAAPGIPDPGHPFVLVAKDLAPADTALLDLDKVLALVTTEGGPTSHTAILAREKSIVAVVGASGAGPRRRSDGDRGCRRRRRHGRPQRRRPRAGEEPGRRSRGRRLRPDHGRRAVRRHEGPAAREPRQARRCRRGRRARRRGRRPLPHRVPLPQLQLRPDRRGAARRVRRAAQRLPRQEGRRARARRRRRQAAPVPQRRARGEPGAGSPGPARPPRERGHPA